MKKILFFYPNTSNDGVVSNTVAVLTAIAKQCGYLVNYFDTVFYQKQATAAEEREKTGEFKTIDREAFQAFIKTKSHKKMSSDLLKTILTYKPDILAVTANSIEYRLFCDLTDQFTNIEQKPYVIIGGVHATIAPDEVINNRFVDAVCVGEGEQAWREFLLSFQTGKVSTKILNIWIKKKSKIYRNPLRPLLSSEDLWSITPDYNFFNDDRYLLKPFDGKIFKRGSIELSRGCPFSCSYCSNSALKKAYKGLGKYIRIRPFQSIQEELIRQKNMGAEIIKVQDESLLTMPLTHLKNICSWYAANIKIPMMLQTRAESVTEEKIRVLAAMNIPLQMSLGVESGCDRILRDVCNRKTTKKQVIKAYQILRKHKLRTTAYTMIGFPSETRDEVFMTIELIRECNVDNSIMSILYPFKGTPIRDYCQKHKLITGDDRPNTFTNDSILKNQPMTPAQITNLRRVYALYTKLPKKYYSQIYKCEMQFESNKELYEKLVKLVNDKYYSVWDISPYLKTIHGITKEIQGLTVKNEQYFPNLSFY